jgi:chromosome partitioning protein
VIDLDPQANSSQYLLGDRFDEDQLGVADFFQNSLSARYVPAEDNLFQYIHDTPFERLHVMPAAPELDHMQGKLAAKHKIYKLRDAVEHLYPQFDAIYIDTPPAFNFYSLSALIAAHGVIVPFDCDDFARRALFSLIENIFEVRIDHNPALELEGIVVNQYQPRPQLPYKLVDELREAELPVLKSFLSASVKMRESHGCCLPMIHMAPTHKLTLEFLALHDELTRMRVQAERAAGTGSSLAYA